MRMELFKKNYGSSGYTQVWFYPDSGNFVIDSPRESLYSPKELHELGSALVRFAAAAEGLVDAHHKQMETIARLTK